MDLLNIQPYGECKTGRHHENYFSTFVTIGAHKFWLTDKRTLFPRTFSFNSIPTSYIESNAVRSIEYYGLHVDKE